MTTTIPLDINFQHNHMVVHDRYMETALHHSLGGFRFWVLQHFRWLQGLILADIDIQSCQGDPFGDCEIIRDEVILAKMKTLITKDGIVVELTLYPVD